MSDAWMQLLSDEVGPLDVPVDFQEGALAGVGARLLAAWHLDDLDSALECDAMSWEILGAVARRSDLRSGDQAPRWVRDAREILEASFRNPVGLPELARSAGVHPVHFAAVFRRSYGCSVGEYRRRLRLAFVCRQLASAKPSLAEIAQQAGFSDQSHMTRTFKQFTGNTPGEYRKRWKRGHRYHIGLWV
ncbi:helix-turn-helix domain-containing protein [Pendulispora albinea]|uniref:AraC family transcriptional regulator n=1 Tax=Pendulispora albinea TaxID=2741071 RepID=A0ABZ2LV76_9BACT